MKKMAIALVSAAVLVSACKEEKVVEEKATLDLTTAKNKLSYAVGYQFARSMKESGVENDLDMSVAAQAMTDTLSEEGSKMTEADVIAALKENQERKVKEAQEEAVAMSAKGEAFLEENKAKEGVVTTESGLQYKVITEGTGASATEESSVELHYKGTLIDGKVFDSSYDRGQPATFPVSGVIPGFKEGIMLMKEGGKSTLYIPASLAYGENGPPGIGANQALIFEIELLKVK